VIGHYLRCVERGDFGWRRRPTLCPEGAHSEDYDWRVVGDLVDLFGWNDKSITEGNYLLRPLVSTVRGRPLTMWGRRSVFRRWIESWAAEHPAGLRVPQELGQSQLIDVTPTRAAHPLLAAPGTDAADARLAAPAASSVEPAAPGRSPEVDAGGELPKDNPLAAMRRTREALMREQKIVLPMETAEQHRLVLKKLGLDPNKKPPRGYGYETFRRKVAADG
jgi:hypothetical protein